jgi:hypothetical protein
VWPRIVELMLGLWLLASPFVFRHDPSATVHWYNDIFCGFLVILVSLLSFAEPCRYAHVATIGIGLWLIGFGYLAAPYPPPVALQNNLVVGMLLVMFAIIPNEASQPPRAWRQLKP